MIIVTRALLTGLVAGSSIGPVAMWGGQMRSRGYKEAVSVIFGASAADIVISVALITLAKWSGVSIDTLKAYFDWATIPGLLVIGVVLAYMASRPVGGKKWPASLRFAAAFVSTMAPNTIAFVAGCVIVGWQVGDDLHIFLPFFAVGVMFAWVANIELFHLLQERAALVTVAIGGVCVVTAVAKAVALFA